MNSEPDILVLDPGGSKCEALLVRADGTVQGWGHASQPGLSGRSVDVMLQAARRASGRRRKLALRTGVLSCTPPAAAQLVRRLRLGQFHLLNELEGPLTLFGETCGVVVVAGTGACVSAKTRRGRYLTLDGMGPMLGDVGSGYEIGRAALRATVRGVWHPRHRTRLRDRIFNACDQLMDARPRTKRAHRPPSDMKGILAYSQAAQAVRNRLDPSAVRLRNLIQFSLLPHDRSVIASLARIVDEEAEAGDAVAIRILHDAADGLAATVRDLTDRLGIARERYLLVGTGSVAMRSAIYWHRFCRQVKKFAPRFVLRQSPYPPVVGSALCILRQLNRRDAAAIQCRLFGSFENYQRHHEHAH